MSASSEKHPEYLWECADCYDMMNHGSFRTMKPEPEQWLLRFAIGDGPWVDLDASHLMLGLHDLYKRAKSKGTNPKLTAAMQPYLNIKLLLSETGEWKTL